MGQDDPLDADNRDQTAWMFDRAKGFSQDDVAEVGTKGFDPSVRDPFLTIWIWPRATIRGIVDTNPRLHVIPIAIVTGIIQVLNRASHRNAGDQLSFSAILALAIALGPLSGLLGLYLAGWLVGLTGRRMGGRATTEQVATAIAWSGVPTLATIPIWIVQLTLAGHEMFTSETPWLDSHPAQGLILLATEIVGFVLGIWSVVILLKAVGEVHGFSAWRALGALVLSVFVAVLPFLLVFLVFLVVLRGQ